MRRRVLIYRWDERAGRMRLRGVGIRLRQHDRRTLETALVRQYESLIAELERGETEPTILFEAVMAQPRRVSGFRVRWAADSRARCPELALEPIVDTHPQGYTVTVDGPLMVRPAAGPRELAVGGKMAWVNQFMTDIKERLSTTGPVRMNNADRVGMAFALSQLHDLCRKRPEDLAVVLLAGYVSLGERVSDSTKPEEAALYRLAARVLDQWCAPGPSAPADVAPKTSGSQPETTASRVDWSWA